MTATEEWRSGGVEEWIFSALASLSTCNYRSCLEIQKREPRKSCWTNQNFNLPLTVVSKPDPTKLLMLNGSCSSSPRVGATEDKPCRQAPFSSFSLESVFSGIN